MTYDGPEDEDRIDAPMLSKVLYFMNTTLPKRTKICLLGGSALTYLGVRTSGSEDVDFLPLNHESDISESLRTVNAHLEKRHLYIEVQDEYGNPKKRYSLPEKAHIQNLGYNLTSVRLPKAFSERAHKMKKIPWVMPQGGEEINIPTRKIFTRIELYTPDLLDMFMVKLFAGREKDKKDLHALLGSIPKTKRFYTRYAKELRGRMYEYLECNPARKESKRAIELYKYFQREHSYLEKLDELQVANLLL